MSLIAARGIQKPFGHGNGFCINTLIFQVLLRWESFSLKSSYTYVCCIYTFTHRYIYLCVKERSDAIVLLFPPLYRQGCCQHPNTSSIFSKTCHAPFMSGTKMLWICPDLMFPFQWRAAPSAPSDPTECLFFFSCMIMYDMGTFVSLARWDQHCPHSDPLYPFPTSFVLQLRHRRRRASLKSQPSQRLSS